MKHSPIIYFDNAATSFPKPRRTLLGVGRCLSCYCGNPGRGSHTLAMRSAEKVYECREEIAAFLGIDAPEKIIFTMNTTYALILLLKGLLREGDHVLISDMEHNSVYRPIAALAAAGKITYDIFPTHPTDVRRSPTRICAGIARLIRPETKLLICAHASNICSSSLPLGAIGNFCRKHGILFAVDAAQSAGHLPIHMKEMKIDALCAPGHKGLYGIQGCGFLALSDAIPLETVIEGGNGFDSLEAAMPQVLPERLEVGTLPTPSIVGLLEGIRFIRSVGVGEILAHEKVLYAEAAARLDAIPGITRYVPREVGSILLFSAGGIPSEQVAARLAGVGICVRSGFHCSALGHRTLGTDADGAVRLGFGYFNTVAELDVLYRELRGIVK